VAKRILSTLVLWLVVLAVLRWFRAPGAVALIVLVSVLTLRELYQLLAAARFAPFAGLGMAFGALLTAAPWMEARFGWPAHPLLALATVIFAVRVVGERAAEKRVEALVSTVFGLVFVSLLLQYLVRIVTPLPFLPGGDPVAPAARLWLGIWVIAVAKFCDVGALLTGLAVGRHAMAPQISPKKTWEGAAGGVLTYVGVGTLIAWLGRADLAATLPPGRAALIAAPIGAIAIVSDLIESIIKRRAALKDSGGSVPGIGGIFDVSDSLLLAAPVGYFLLRLP
jgi:phosphatidate cytidylyltransferase